MNKSVSIKRLLAAAIALVVAVCGFYMSALTAPARAEEAAEQPSVYVLHAKVDATWENPHAWAWNADSGKGAFSSWPGHAMTKDTANDGWYYIYLPSFADTIIINANAAAVQTAGVTVTGQEAWVTVGAEQDADNNYAATVSYEAATTGELPEYVKAINISVYAPETWTGVGIWAWSTSGKNVFAAWPGEAAVKASDGWYNLEIPSVTQGEQVTKIIVNEAVDGGSQTKDCDLDQSQLSDDFIPTVYIVVDKNSADMTKAEAELAYDAKPDVTPKFKVHAKVPSNWILPSVWAWSDPDGTNAYANWPGEEMTQNGEWFELSVPEFVNSIILNAGEFVGEQTVDIKGIEAKEMWIVIGEKDPDSDNKYKAAVYYSLADATAKPDSGNPLSAGAIAGIVVGAVAVVAVAAVVTILVIKKRKN